ATEQFGREGHLFRTVHLRLDDVDRAGASVLARGVALEVVHGGEAGEQAVHDAFRHFVAFLVEDGIVGHQVSDVADEQQGAAMQGQLAVAVGLGVDAIRVHGAGDALAALFQLLDQIALHQAEPVAVDDGLVVGVDGGNGVFAVHDGGQRRFHQDVLHAGGVGLADGAGRVDLDLEVDAVVLEQHGDRRAGIALEAEQLLRILQAAGAAILQRYDQLAAFDAVAGGVDVRAVFQRRGLIEESAGVGDALAGAICFGDGVGAVQGVIQRTPAGIGGVEREASVHDRHHQLRAGHVSDFFVDVLGGGLEVFGFGQQIADFLQEGLVGDGVMGLTGASLMPGIDLCLQFVAFGQQSAILRRQIVDDAVGTGPEGRGIDAGTGNRFVVHKVVQDFGDLQATDLNALSHYSPHLVLLQIRRTILLVVRVDGYYLKRYGKSVGPAAPFREPNTLAGDRPRTRNGCFVLYL